MPIELQGEVNAVIELDGEVDGYVPTASGGCDGTQLDFSCAENSGHVGWF